MRPVLKVDLRALAENYEMLATTASPAECAGVVKADAYRLGMNVVARVLADAGCRSFFVARATEAIALRKLLPQAHVYVLEGVNNASAAAVRDNDIVPVLNSLQQVDSWLSICGRSKAAAALHLDSGMNRLGFDDAEIDALVRNPGALGRLEINLILTHLVAADLPDMASISRQLARFGDWQTRFPDARTSIGNSAGTLLGESTTGSVARPGIALYGGNPFLNRASPVRPVISLEAPILQVRSISPGESVGYGGDFVATSQRRIATIAAGYADGIPRSLNRQGSVLIDGERAPFVGRVSMDTTTVDVSEIPAKRSMVGALAMFIGGENTLERVAAAASTNSHEIMTGLSERCDRHYVQP